MKTVKIILLSFLVAGALTVTACESDVEVKEGTDSTAMEVNADTAANATERTVDNAGQEMGDEMLEKAVETKLIAEPGFDGVTVESKADGIIVLNGTATTDAEKTKAEEIAKGTDGVKGVENNIMVAAQ
jgi:osmotically-inducible protein OsmY